jgi:hypothetical protein
MSTLITATSAGRSPAYALARHNEGAASLLGDSYAILKLLIAPELLYQINSFLVRHHAALLESRVQEMPFSGAADWAAQPSQRPDFAGVNTCDTIASPSMMLEYAAIIPAKVAQHPLRFQTEDAHIDGGPYVISLRHLRQLR